MEKFKVVFTGNCLPGFEPHQVREAFARRFGMDEARVGRLFAGGEVVLRKELPHEQAYLLKSRLDALGMHIRLDRLAPVFETSHLSLVEDPDLEQREEEPAPAAGSVAPTPGSGAVMSCPKCGHEQPTAAECRQCGIIVQKYLDLQAAPPPAPVSARPVPLPAPVSRDSGDGFRQVSHKEALMGSWKVIAPIVGILLVGWKFYDRAVPDDYTLDELREEYELACYEDAHCYQLLSAQWDECVARADFSRYEDAALSDKLNELDAFNARLDACIVDENGERMFYDAW